MNATQQQQQQQRGTCYHPTEPSNNSKTSNSSPAEQISNPHTQRGRGAERITCRSETTQQAAANNTQSLQKVKSLCLLLMPLLCSQPLNSVSSVQPCKRKSQQLAPGHNLCPLPSHSAPLVLAAAAAAMLRQAGGSCVGWKPARTQHDTPRAASSQQQQQQQPGSERE